MMKELTKRVGIRILLLAAIILLFCMNAFAEGGLSFPDVTQTDCAWDNGNLISETVHDLNGLPAVNSRGFYRAEYSWDERGNLLSEVYYGLNGEKAVADQGYAYAVYTYFTDRNENSHILTVVASPSSVRIAHLPGIITSGVPPLPSGSASHDTNNIITAISIARIKQNLFFFIVFSFSSGVRTS